MRKEVLFCVLVVIFVLIIGCSGGATEKKAVKITADETPASDARAAVPAGEQLADLGSAPTDYCITYKVSIPNVQDYAAEAEYCRKGSDAQSTVTVNGFQATTVCSGGKGNTCAAGTCFPDTGACQSIHEPYATVDVSDLRYYSKAASRKIAGFEARCYTLDVKNIPGVTPTGDSKMDVSTLCFHPQKKTLIYFEGQGSTIEVTKFVTPAPAGKFGTA